MMDGKTVCGEYELRRRLGFLSGQCFNIAGNIIAQDETINELADDYIAGAVYDLASDLFDEGVKRKFVGWADKAADKIIGGEK